MKIKLNKDKSRYTSSNQLYDSVSVTKIHVKTIILHKKQTDMQNNISRHSISLQIIGDSNFEPERDILIEQFSTWCYKKTPPGLTKITLNM